MRAFLLILAFCSLAYGMSPNLNDYSDPESVYVEFRNVFDNGQDQSFTQVSSTPNYQDLRDGAIVVYISTPTAGNVSLMLRVGATIYASPMFPVIKGR